MTVGLSGAGIESDPWLIETDEQMAAVLRDNIGSGYYRLLIDIATPISLTGLLTIASEAGGYAPKVIDLNGFTLRIYMARADSGACAVLSVLKLLNGVLEFDLNMTGTSQTVYVLYMVFLKDVAIRGRVRGTGAASATVNVLFSETSHASLSMRELTRVVMTELGAPETAITRWNRTYITTAVPIDGVYVRGAVTNMRAGMVSMARIITLIDLPAAFVAQGWWESSLLLYPYQFQSVELNVQSKVSGVPVARLVWLQNDRLTRLLGKTDVVGLGEWTATVRHGTPFTLLASEDFGLQVLRPGMAVAAGEWYSPPAASDYVYQAVSSGVLPALDGVTWAGVSIVLASVTLEPLKRQPVTASRRLSVVLDSSVITLTLDTSSGGGPVIEGDPAYLDGIVEEQHPILGTVRPIANSEVAVFERRGSSYVAMGRALSNSLGEFRVETEVYGGGDVFAFAVDFPGVTWQPSSTLSIGDRVRPTANNGYVYEVVSAGVSGATEPDWWADAGDGTEGFIGTARAKARPYYQPQAHGPLKMTLIT